MASSSTVLVLGGRLLVALAVAIGMVAGAIPTTAQEQEPRPTRDATPPAGDDGDDTPSGTGVQGNGYTSPDFGYRLTWDEQVWTVEDELVLDGYNGLQLGTEISIFYLEGYEGFGGDPEECLSDAVNEIALRENVAGLESVNRPLPVEDSANAALFLYTLTFEDGGAVDVLEYVECRSLIEDRAVLEITFQTAEQAYDAELRAYRDLLAALMLPEPVA